MRTISLIVMVVLAACESSPPRSGTTGMPGPVPQPYAGGMTCRQIIECIGGCADASCQNTCVSRGSPEGQAGVRAIQQCTLQSQCADSACVSARCSAELAACENGTAVATTSGAPAPGQAAAGQVAPGPAASDEQFIFRRTDGLEMVSQTIVVERGRAVAMNGVWKDSLHGLTLEIDGSSYTLTYESSYTTTDQMGRASGGGGVANVETGHWRLEGATLVFSPSAVRGRAVNANDRYAEQTTAKAEGERRWAVEGLMMNYQRPDDGAVHPVEGIAIAGPTPTWAYSPSGTWELTLRRAR